MPFVEDVGAFFNVAEFATTASRTPAAGGGATSGNVILDLGEAELDGLVVEGPSCAVSATTWPTLAVGDTLVISTVSYRVRTVIAQADGAIVRCQLARA